jgi:uncharacterized protein (TIGR02246 family)
MDRRMCRAVAAAGVAAVVGFSLYHSAAQEKAAPPSADAGKEKAGDVAEVRKTGEKFVRAFNKGDAKAMAALWAPEGEYVGPDGDTVKGRDAIQKDYAEFFEKNRKARIELFPETVRRFGPHTALAEGSLKLYLPGEKEPGESRYSVLYVRGDDGWEMATVREWVPDPATLVSLKDVEWLIGDWAAKGEGGEVSVHYGWDEAHTYMRGQYTIKRDGKAASSGMQVLARDPAGGLRSWVFDSSGEFGESSWAREGNRWVLTATGTLPDGSATTATNILIPLGRDVFTWQSVERTAGGVDVPDLAPVKVRRVKADK